LQDFDTWGDEAVVCDPWLDRTMNPDEMFDDMFDDTWRFKVSALVGRSGRAVESPF
jgi:hypothetical protein